MDHVTGTCGNTWPGWTCHQPNCHRDESLRSYVPQKRQSMRRPLPLIRINTYEVRIRFQSCFSTWKIHGVNVLTLLPESLWQASAEDDVGGRRSRWKRRSLRLIRCNRRVHHSTGALLFTRLFATLRTPLPPRRRVGNPG